MADPSATNFRYPEDHDQRFKVLIREFFPEFLTLFFPDYAQRFDFSTLQWLDTELLPNPPEGSRHKLDLVAKLRAIESIQGERDEQGDESEDELKPNEWLALVHMEIESGDRTTSIKPRLPAYVLHLQEHHSLPVLPIVIYLDVALDGIGIDTVVRRFWQLEILKLQYLYVGLPGLSAEYYIQGDSLLGVGLSGLMKLPVGRIHELARQAFLKLRGADTILTQQQQFLLEECLQAYLPLPKPEVRKIQQEVEIAMPQERVPLRRNKTLYDDLLEERNLAREEGLKEGQLILLESQLQTRFGPLDALMLARLRLKTAEELRQLGTRLLQAGSLQELGLAEKS